jgi:XapX domain-containing protein
MPLDYWKALIGLILSFVFGAFCRYGGIPAPAPPTILGVLLILAMTLGFSTADKILSSFAKDSKETPTKKTTTLKSYSRNSPTDTL